GSADRGTGARRRRIRSGSQRHPHAAPCMSMSTSTRPAPLAHNLPDGTSTSLAAPTPDSRPHWADAAPGQPTSRSVYILSGRDAELDVRGSGGEPDAAPAAVGVWRGRLGL